MYFTWFFDWVWVIFKGQAGICINIHAVFVVWAWVWAKTITAVIKSLLLFYASSLKLVMMAFYESFGLRSNFGNLRFIIFHSLVLELLFAMNDERNIERHIHPKTLSLIICNSIVGHNQTIYLWMYVSNCKIEMMDSHRYSELHREKHDFDIGDMYICQKDPVNTYYYYQYYYYLHH